MPYSQTIPTDKYQKLPSAGQLKQYGHEREITLAVSEPLRDEWLLQHSAMSEEDYAKDPTRNRLVSAYGAHVDSRPLP
jgi:hypothetical protein